MKILVQILMGMAETAAFSLLFHVKAKRILPISLAAGFCWAVYLLLLGQLENVGVSLLVTTAVMCSIAEIFARVFKAPVISFLMPMLVPTVPGSDLYLTTSYLVSGNSDAWIHQLNILLTKAGAIACGIILVACVVHLPREIGKMRRK